MINNITGEIMVVDDTPANLQLLNSILTSAGYKVRPTKNPRLAIKAAQASQPDLILLDVKMPDMDGFEVCSRLKEDERTREIPIIFVSALKNMDDQVKGFSAGAVDFITKPYQKAEILARVKTHVELRNMHRHLENLVTERTGELIMAHEAIKQSEAKFKGLFDDALDMIHIIGQDGRIIDANPMELQTLGYSRDQYIGKPMLDFVHPDKRAETTRALRKGLTGKSIKNFETIFVPKDAPPVYVEVNSVPQIENGKIISSRAICRNITIRKKEEKERIKLQDLLRQTQRMEAMGTLAGGIAHDFNNILSPILGYAELTQQAVEHDGNLWTYQNRIIEAGHRAKDLIQQILSFSRHDEVEWVPLRIHKVIKEALALLRASIPATIEIEKDIATTSGVVLADSTQIHQVIMNLCTNAYHAMQDTRGILEVSLVAVELSLDDLRNADQALAPGPYLKLVVSDTGHGMDQATVEHIFEPYFTTKEKGKGTGLGLATVHGIIKNHGGYITVHSIPDEGTSFHIYLPEVATENTVEVASRFSPSLQGKEHILIVDDEESIVQMERFMLENLGYKVTTSTNSKKAWAMLEKQPRRFDLVITDLTMPEMTGLELAQHYVTVRPDASILLCSGYGEAANKTTAVAAGIRQVISKPITQKTLAKAVRQVLDKNV